MNTRQLLFGLVLFVTITTIAMVIMSQNMAAIQVTAFQLFASGTTTPRVLETSTTFFNQSVSGIGSNASSNPKGRRNASGMSNNSSSSSGGAKQNITQDAIQKSVTPKPVTAKPVAVKPAEPTNRPLQCDNCFFSKFRNLTETPEVCSQSASGSVQPELVMLITTTLDGLERRQAIRETWVTVTRNNTAHVRHVFLLGTDGQGRVSKEVRAESAHYRDLLVSDFVDAYGNLTYKTLAGLHYLVDHCGMAKFFLKTDQDMYVFVDRLLDLARRNENTLKTSLGGSCYQTGKPWRNPKTKYYASIRSYPQNTYPGFCSGTGYIGSVSLARKALETSPNIPFFHLEDVYLTLVLRHVGYKLTKYSGFAEGSGVCKTPDRARRTLTIHEVSAVTMRDIWAKKCGV